MGNLADTYGTDVEIYRGADGLVWADCRTGIPHQATEVLRGCGFEPARPTPDSLRLPDHMGYTDRQCAASTAASLLSDFGYQAAIAPELVVGYIGNTDVASRARLAAARRRSTAAKAPATAPAPAVPAPGRPAGLSR
ncbi:hypothetical protein [Kitasatospora sp. NPDC090091]|uniref:hypothetical protein n=1 Tax=Kitasatospora sp. NPDC090091 TaxID=3364081 RepID=UPI00380BAD45